MRWTTFIGDTPDMLNLFPLGKAFADKFADKVVRP
jgi:hypothetical protein